MSSEGRSQHHGSPEVVSLVEYSRFIQVALGSARNAAFQARRRMELVPSESPTPPRSVNPRKSRNSCNQQSCRDGPTRKRPGGRPRPLFSRQPVASACTTGWSPMDWRASSTGAAEASLMLRDVRAHALGLGISADQPRAASMAARRQQLHGLADLLCRRPFAIVMLVAGLSASAPLTGWTENVDPPSMPSEALPVPLDLGKTPQTRMIIVHRW